MLDYVMLLSSVTAVNDAVPTLNSSLSVSTGSTVNTSTYWYLLTEFIPDKMKQWRWWLTWLSDVFATDKLPSRCEFRQQAFPILQLYTSLSHRAEVSRLCLAHHSDCNPQPPPSFTHPAHICSVVEQMDQLTMECQCVICADPWFFQRLNGLFDIAVFIILKSDYWSEIT